MSELRRSTSIPTRACDLIYERWRRPLSDAVPNCQEDVNHVSTN